MNEEHGFLNTIFAAPSDRTAKLVYADWLQERDDPRSEFLRLRVSHDQGDRGTGSREQALRTTIDPTWLAMIDTLGCSPVAGTLAIDMSRFPLLEPFGMRGRLVTFLSQFRGEGESLDGLAEDTRFLVDFPESDCYYGSGSYLTYPFLCHYPSKQSSPTAADILAALQARRFSEMGDQDGSQRDEIHTNPEHQHIFGHSADAMEDEIAGIQESDAEHSLLRSYVVDNRLWYVLLHDEARPSAEFMFSHHVLLFAIGVSPHANRLLGVVACQNCYNLCD